MKIEAKTLVTPDMVKPTRKDFRMRGVFNPSAIRLKNKKILLYARVAETPQHDERTFLVPQFCGKDLFKCKIEKMSRRKMKLAPDFYWLSDDISRLPTISHFRKILLDKSGLEVEKVSEKPDFYGIRDDGDFGVEDPRITYFKNEKRYAMTYVSVSLHGGVSTSLATSKNLSKWKREGIIFRQQNKDVVIFPEKINGYYVALHRPEGTMIFSKPSIWISYSKDLIFWGKDRPILDPRNNAWDYLRIGAGTVPIKTKEGWLEIYHGVGLTRKRNPNSHKIYMAGALLFDLKNPAKVIGRTHAKEPLFGSDLDSEKKGFNDKVVFPSGLVTTPDKKSVLIYGGGADSVITVRKMSLKSVLNSMK